MIFTTLKQSSGDLYFDFFLFLGIIRISGGNLGNFSNRFEGNIRYISIGFCLSSKPRNIRLKSCRGNKIGVLSKFGYGYLPICGSRMTIMKARCIDFDCSRFRGKDLGCRYCRNLGLSNFRPE
jgi:hypothetical protein